jgi:hypothetical protein
MIIGTRKRSCPKKLSFFGTNRRLGTGFLPRGAKHPSPEEEAEGGGRSRLHKRK